MKRARMLGMVGAMVLGLAQPSVADPDAPYAQRLGWRLGVQAFCFYRVTFFEMVDHLEAIGIRNLEAYPGQRLGGDFGNQRFDPTMPEEARKAVLDRLESAGIGLVNIGVAPLTADEPATREWFEFAKSMGVETIVAEPPAEALDLVDRLANEYKFDVAIHNHPEPSAYWNPTTVLNALEGRSDRMGACIDTSHWMRSGVDVLANLNRFEGRIKCFHFGDVQADKFAAFQQKKDEMAGWGQEPTMVQHIREVPNAVYGQGASDMMAWLREIERQKVEALFCVEAFFELEPGETEARIAESAEWFDQAAYQLMKDMITE